MAPAANIPGPAVRVWIRESTSSTLECRVSPRKKSPDISHFGAVSPEMVVMWGRARVVESLLDAGADFAVVAIMAGHASVL